MSLTGKYDDKWALRLAYDETNNAFRYIDAHAGSGNTEVVSEEDAVTTTPTNVPATATGNLYDVMVQCGVDNAIAARLDISLDGGTTYHRIAPGMTLTWNMNGAATQIQVKASSGTVQYYFSGNREV